MNPARRIRLLTKLASVVAHVAGPSGSGKTTLLRRLEAGNPTLVVKDLDDFDAQARQELGAKYVAKKKNYDDEMLRTLYVRRQALLNTYLAKNKEAPVVLAGHHIEGPHTLKFDAKHRFRLDVSAEESVRRRANRGNSPGTENMPKYLKEAKSTIAELRAAGYKKATGDTISAAVSKPSAVIVTGNPDHPTAKNVTKKTVSAFHSKLKRILESEGLDVSFDPGLQHTEPKKADVWMGHSRGADRLRFAPKNTLGIPIGSSRPGAVNHPQDQKWMDDYERDVLKGRSFKDIPVAERPPVPKGHMLVTRKMEREIRSRVRAHMRNIGGKQVMVKAHSRSNS